MANLTYQPITPFTPTTGNTNNVLGVPTDSWDIFGGRIKVKNSRVGEAHSPTQWWESFGDIPDTYLIPQSDSAKNEAYKALANVWVLNELIPFLDDYNASKAMQAVYGQASNAASILGNTPEGQKIQGIMAKYADALKNNAQYRTVAPHEQSTQYARLGNAMEQVGADIYRRGRTSGNASINSTYAWLQDLGRNLKTIGGTPPKNVVDLRNMETTLDDMSKTVPDTFDTYLALAKPPERTYVQRSGNILSNENMNRSGGWW